MKFLNCLFRLLVLAAAANLHATTVVLVHTPTGIYVAADELGTFNVSRRHRVHCKIQKEGNVYFVAGTAYLNDLARWYIKHSSSIAEAANKFSNSEWVDRHWSTVYTPQQHAEAVRGGEHGHGVNQSIFWGIENGIPKYVFVMFWAKDASKLEHSLEICPDDCRTFRCVGYCDVRFASLPNSDPTDPAALKAFVMAEEKLHSDVVGGPVDILRLDASDAIHPQWLEGGARFAAEQKRMRTMAESTKIGKKTPKRSPGRQSAGKK